MPPTPTTTRTTTQTAARRAAPLSADDRRASILDATVPLLMEHGASVTSRQIADAAGVAEGTIFRAFGDKDAILKAAVDRFLDPERLRNALRSIDPEDPLERKIHDLVFHMRTYFTGILGVMAAVGMGAPPDRPQAHNRFLDLVERLLVSDAELLRVDPAVVAHTVRLLAFAASIEPINREYQFTTEQLTDLIVHGIARDKDS